MERSTFSLGLDPPRAGGQTARIAEILRRHRGVIAVLGIVAAAVVVAWPSLQDGGLFFDDWWVRSLALYDYGPERNGFFGYWDGIYSISTYRPLDVPYFMVHVAFTDFDPFRYQLWGCLISALAGASLYAALRVARLPWPFAVAAALIFVTIPFAASGKFWSSHSLANASIIIFLSGLALGGLGLRAWPKPRWGVLAGSVGLMAVTAAFYELVLPLLAVAPIYYAAAHGRWDRTVLVKTAADIGAACLVLAIFRSSGRTETAPADQWWPHAREMIDEATTLFTGGLVPDGRWRLILFAVLIALVAGLVLRMITDRHMALRALAQSRRRLAGIAGIAALGFGAGLLGYVFLVPDPWYRPLAPGQGDRSNSIAVIGYSISYTAAAAFFATLAVAAVPRRWAAAGSVVVFSTLVLMFAGSFTSESRAKGDLFVAQWQRSSALYEAIDETLKVPPRPGTLVLGFGSTAYQAPLIPSLGDWADYDAAVKLATDTGTVRAAAIFETQQVVCGAAGLTLPAQYQGGPVFLGSGWSADYGTIMFMQPYEGRTRSIDSRAECRSALGRFEPGPLY